MKVFLSIISHGHESIINEIGCLADLAQDYNVILKSNKLGDDFEELSQNKNITWINGTYDLGFGENNNFVFNYCVNSLAMEECDYFIVLNPDVKICREQISTLIDNMHSSDTKISAINLYKDHNKQEYDNSIRNFPTFKSFIKSFLGLGNDSIIEKKNIVGSCYIDWAAGSFLAFKASHYQLLGGFDEGYFMYCEDIDICFRSMRANVKVKYFPNIEAVHLAQHQNRTVFSRHFIWHLQSVFRFLLSKRKVTRVKSSLYQSKLN